MTNPEDFIDDGHGLMRRKRVRTGRHIRVPEPPPIATHENVQAELIAARAAERLLTRQARWRDDGHGLVSPDVPSKVSERALDVPARPAMPRGAPVSMRLEATPHGMRIVTRYAP